MSKANEPADLWAVTRMGGASTALNGRGVFPVTTYDKDIDESLTQLYSLPDQIVLTRVYWYSEALRWLARFLDSPDA